MHEELGGAQLLGKGFKLRRIREVEEII